MRYETEAVPIDSDNWRGGFSDGMFCVLYQKCRHTSHVRAILLRLKRYIMVRLLNLNRHNIASVNFMPFFLK
jgi:hypothetical protein